MVRIRLRQRRKEGQGLKHFLTQSSERGRRRIGSGLNLRDGVGASCSLVGEDWGKKLKKWDRIVGKKEVKKPSKLGVKIEKANSWTGKTQKEKGGGESPFG